jgi:hypothetical protein
MGLFGTFYLPPTPNQSWSKDRTHVVYHKHTEESWVELFIDLMYVALYITLGSAIEHCGVGGIVLYVSSVHPHSLSLLSCS